MHFNCARWVKALVCIDEDFLPCSKIVYSNDMTRQLVAALPGAVGFIAASDVAADMKVLRINGKLPGDPDYPLR